MNRFIILSIIYLSLFYFNSVESGTTSLYVDFQSTNDSLSCGVVHTIACANIQSAINAFNSYDTKNDQLILLMRQGNYLAANNSGLNLFGLDLVIQPIPGSDGPVNIDLNQTQFATIIYPFNQTVDPAIETTILIQDINFANGFANSQLTLYGGLLQIQTNTTVSVTIENSLLSTFNGGWGGMIYTDSLELDGGNVAITINNSTLQGASGGFGSAIYSEKGNITINNCDIINNNATGSIITVDQGSLILNNVNFNGNLITIDLGGHISSTSGTLTVTGTNFNSNQAPSSPTSNIILIYNSYGSGSIDNCNFFNNNYMKVLQTETSPFKLTNSNITLSSFESIVFQDHSTLIIDNCIFTNNTVTDAVVFSSGTFSSPSTLTVTNSQFIGTGYTRASNGSNIVLEGAKQVTIENTVFKSFNNVSNSQINCQNSSLVLNNNTAINTHYNVDCATNQCDISGKDKVTCNGEQTSSGAPNENSSHEKKSNKKKLSNGAVAGIVVGVLAGVAFLSLTIFIIYKRNENRLKYSSYK